jgi:hypothetical protein
VGPTRVGRGLPRPEADANVGPRRAQRAAGRLEAAQKIVTAAKGHARLGLMRRCPGIVASERHSGEDQGDSREHRRGDGLVEDQDARCRSTPTPYIA